MDMRLTGLLLASFVILAPAMYFDLGEQEEKCIIEEIPEDTLVSGQWRVLLLYNVIYIYIFALLYNMNQLFDPE